MMESPAPMEANVEEVCLKSEHSLGLEGVCIKSEPSWTDACVKDEPSCSDACVKDEPSCSDAFVKDEPSCSDACIQDEPSSLEAADARGISEATAAVRLYADHVVKDELVFSPELVQPRRVLCAAPDATTAGSSKQPQPSQPQDPATTCKPRNQKKILNPFPCDICRRWFPTKRTLIEHALSHVYACRTCKTPFSTEILLQKHSCCICKVCNKPSAWGNHKDCPRVFTCKCGEKFTHDRAFKTHQKTHVDIYGNCPLCGRQFRNKTDLVKHVTKMKFPCIYCGRCFSNLDEFSEHNAKLPEPNHSCKICRETFEDSFALASHSKSHGAPMRSYSRKPKPVNTQKITNGKELVNSVVKTVNQYEIPIEFGKEIDGKGDVKNDGEKPCDKLDGDIEERVEGAALKLNCVKVEFEDEEMREPNQETLDMHLEGVNECKVGGVVTEKTVKRIEGVNAKTDGRDEDMREGIENVDVFGTGPTPFVEVEFEFRDIKKEPTERLKVSNLGSDEVMDEHGDVGLPFELGPAATGPARPAPVRGRVPAVYVCQKEPVLMQDRFALRDCWVRLESCPIPPQPTIETLQDIANSNTYACDTCGKRYTLKRHLIRHVKRHRKNKTRFSLPKKRNNNVKKPITCEVCKKNFTRLQSLRVHSRIHTGAKPYACGICNKQFGVLGNYKNHKRVHTGERPYSCNICKKDFSQISHLRSHQRTHTGEKPHACELCEKEFARSSQLKRHMRVHSGEKPYACSICQRHFAEPGTLITHQRIHTGDRPYSCDICKKEFTQSSSLTVHKRTHTGERPYGCNVCPKRFSDSSTLRAHRRIHTGEKPHSCRAEPTFSIKNT